MNKVSMSALMCLCLVPDVGTKELGRNSICPQKFHNQVRWVGEGH